MGSGCSRKLKERRFLILGLDGVGKKTLLKRLGSEPLQHHVLFEGFDYWSTRHGRCNYVCWTLGTDAAKPKNKSKYKEMFRNAVALIFVVDASDSARFEEAKTEFHRIYNEISISKNTVLVFANKQDIEGAASERDMKSYLNLYSIRASTWNIYASSFTRGDGLEASLMWLECETGKNIRD